MYIRMCTLASVQCCTRVTAHAQLENLAKNSKDSQHLPFTVALIESASRKSICLQTLKVGANDRSAQELQNGL